MNTFFRNNWQKLFVAIVVLALVILAFVFMAWPTEEHRDGDDGGTTRPSQELFLDG